MHTTTIRYHTIQLSIYQLSIRWPVLVAANAGMDPKLDTFIGGAQQWSETSDCIGGLKGNVTKTCCSNDDLLADLMDDDDDDDDEAEGNSNGW
jgi:hypothetical protein